MEPSTSAPDSDYESPHPIDDNGVNQLIIGPDEDELEELSSDFAALQARYGSL